MYTLEFDEQSRVLTQRASGLWDMEEFVRYQAEFTAFVTRLRDDGRPCTMLFDSRDITTVRRGGERIFQDDRCEDHEP